MHDSFKPIITDLISEGFHQLPDGNNKHGKELDFNITTYSLKTKLSFKFDNLDHFIEFLMLTQPINEEKKKLIQATMLELGIPVDGFFYVNFFEKGKELEM